jgi:hypothetical protein
MARANSSAADAASTPARERCVTSYPVRRGYHPGPLYPPDVSRLAGVVDIHAHAHPGQQDAFATATFASRSEMRGILFKTIVGKPDAVGAVRDVQERLNRWAETEGVTPIVCWSGHILGARGAGVTVAETKRALDSGITAIWLPVFNHANTLNTVGGKPMWWDASADPDLHTAPLTWEESRERGHFLLAENGKLLDEVRDIVRFCADRDAPLFFGHATHAELFALAEEAGRLGFKRAVIDHPFSPFIDLSIEEMRQVAACGVTLNFTYDELSPLLGIDPAKMCAAIKAVGAQHCTLSSDVGEPLFPNTVEAMRQICAYMEAFGLTPDELWLVSRDNPARLMGLPVMDRSCVSS